MVSAPATRFAKRWLYISHRWLGILTCLFCAMWFISGVVMMYVPYPRLTDRERLALAGLIDWTQVAIPPDDALRAAGVARYPTQLRLATFLGEPVFRVVDSAIRCTVSARDGRMIGETDEKMALAVIAETRSDASRATVETLVRDQWTVAQGFNPHRPLHKVSLHDEAGAELYVSSRTGEIVQATQRRERFWNWLGAVPHWLYPTVLRQDGDAWRQVVLWTSGPASVGAIAGLWIGILRLRARHRYRGGRLTPYRGWMKWHHVAGLVAGLFLTTWLASGWLSVNPFHLFDRASVSLEALRSYAGESAPTFAGDAGVLRRLPAPGAREARFVWFDGRPLIVATDEALAQTVFDARNGDPVVLSNADIWGAAQRLVPGGLLLDLVRITDEDAYWYSHHAERRLPVLRAVFGDDAETWIYIDPETGEVIGRTNASGRAYRWLFNALHDFDLRILLRHRPAWDIVVGSLSLGGLIVSVSGIVIGWRRIGRNLEARTRTHR